MKYQSLKDMILGAMVATLIVGAAPTAFAKVSEMNIPVNFNNIKVVINGKELKTDKEPFTYEGTTYLPVRAVAEVVGKDVNWDSKTQTVTLNDRNQSNQEDTSATNNSVDKSYSRTTPAPVGVEQTYTSNSKYSTSHTTTIKIVESYRGSSAWSKIKDANMFNDEPPAGKEYILVKVKAYVKSVKDDKAVNFSSYDFTPFSGSNSEYSRASVVEPDPEFGGSVYAGGSTEGYIAFLVDKSDTSPKVVFGEDYNGTGGIWFSITK